MSDVPTSPRTLAHRIETLEVKGPPSAVHMAGPGASYFSDSVTACGVESLKYAHESVRHLPVSEITCEECQRIALATPLEHRTMSGRSSRGRGPLKGGGTVYATDVRCACGEKARFNMAPSAGGTRAVRDWEAEHFAAVEAAAG